MNVQPSNPINIAAVVTPMAATAATVSGKDAPGGATQDSAPADAGNVDFAKLLARVLPGKTSAKVAADTRTLASDAKDDKPKDDPGLITVSGLPVAPSLLTSPALAAPAVAGDRNSSPANTPDKREASSPASNPSGPIIANFMPVPQSPDLKPATEPDAAPITSANALSTANVIAPKPQTLTATVPAAATPTTATSTASTEPPIAAALPAPRPQYEAGPIADATTIKEKPAIQGADASTAPTEHLVPTPAAPPLMRDATSPALQIAMPAQLGSQDWGSQLGQRVVWMSSQQNHVAEIRINPPELGPVELRLTLDGPQSGQNATLHFISPHPEVREAIENSMPRLREIMADAGITLGNATVGSESFHQPQASAQERQSSDTAPAMPLKAASAIESSPVAQRRGNGLVDTFA